MLLGRRRQTTRTVWDRLVCSRAAHSLPPHTIFLPAGRDSTKERAQRALPAGRTPVACLLGWVGCGERALRKYADLYTRRGVDVIALLLKPQHVALPVSRGESTMKCIADVLSAADTRERPIMVQGFSAGAFMYGNLLTELGRRGAEGADFAARIKGSVWDSPVDASGVPFGLSRAIMDGGVAGRSEGTVGQRLLQSALEAYLSPSGPMRQYYQASSDAMHGKAFGAGFSSPLAVPTAVIYSEADTVTRSEDIRAVFDKWREAGSAVEEAVFEGTQHVSHLPADPGRYEQVVARVVREAFAGAPAGLAAGAIR
mmetsp:Transcript_30858/g.97015  ORF Transcript_30858/g.97015 Transcript_30858/m.97015 type:complete len:313 (+) Transcript_30858:103-1041(+)